MNRSTPVAVNHRSAKAPTGTMKSILKYLALSFLSRLSLGSPHSLVNSLAAIQSSRAMPTQTPAMSAWVILLSMACSSVSFHSSCSWSAVLPVYQLEGK